MIRTWHLSVICTWTAALAGGLAEARHAGGGVHNYAIGTSLGVGIGVILAASAWRVGRAGARNTERKDAMSVGLGTIFKEQAIFFAWVGISGFLAGFVTKRVLGM